MTETSSPTPRAPVATAAAGSHDGAEQRVAILTGDRLCERCGYNLMGQNIVREPHYALLVARCPECGAVTPVQEYPLLGRWATRWGIVLAALWLLILVAAWFPSGAGLFGFSMVTAEECSRSYARVLHARFRDDTRVVETAAVAAPGAAPLPAIPIGGAQVIVAPPLPADFEGWWLKQDPAALLAEAGGLRGALDWRGLVYWVPGGLVAFGIGWFWSVALLARRRRVAILFCLSFVGFALMLAAFDILDMRADPPAYYWQAARSQVGPPLMLATLAALCVPLLSGVLVGRALTRGLVRLLLPPRMASALAWLWVAEGRRPPGIVVRTGR